jgi:hypothetical protein
MLMLHRPKWFARRPLPALARMTERRYSADRETWPMVRRGAWAVVAALGCVAGAWLTPLAMADDLPDSTPPPIANGPPGFRDIWEKSQGLRPKPSSDTSPVLIDKLGAKYNIPRNFLVYLPGALTYATLKITIPGFNPLTDETRACFEHRQADCEPLEIAIGSGYVPGRIAFERMSDLFRNKEPNKYPYGYDEYDVGDDNGRTEHYTKEIGANFIYFSCFVDKRTQDWSDKSTCTDHFFYKKTPLRFFIRRERIGLIPEIEAGVRHLMESFEVKGGEKP